MNKIINPISIKIDGRSSQVICKIEIEDGKLTISGVIGPFISGNCRGSCGQIYDEIINNSENIYSKGWTKKLVAEFVIAWENWHLNDMRSGCEHQRKLNWGNKMLKFEGDEEKSGWVYQKDHKEGVLNKPCPTCKYKYGSDWLKEELPKRIIDFLEELPISKKIPIWV